MAWYCPERCCAQQPQRPANENRDLCPGSGGGFILAGGKNNHGEGGYPKTVLKTCSRHLRDEKEKPDSGAMIVVLDKSGSMAAKRSK
jgi:hypothetical protein